MNRHTRIPFLFAGPLTACFIVLLAACSSPVPELIREAPDNAPGLKTVLNAPERHTNQTVRWGGLIINTENRKHSTRLIILALELSSGGKPLNNSVSHGRFIAEFDEFLDPQVYKAERKITLRGRVTGTENLKVGEYDYLHPVVQSELHYLWPVEKEHEHDDFIPHWYHPWYYPYYCNPCYINPRPGHYRKK